MAPSTPTMTKSEAFLGCVGSKSWETMSSVCGTVKTTRGMVSSASRLRDMRLGRWLRSGLKTTGLLRYRYRASRAIRSRVRQVLTCAIWSSSICLPLLLILVLFRLLLVELLDSFLSRLDRLGLLRLAWILWKPLSEATGVNARCSIGQAHDGVPSVVVVQ